MTNQTELIWLIQLYWNHFILSSYSRIHIRHDQCLRSAEPWKECTYSMTLILEHTRIQKGTPVHVFDLSTKWQVILFYDLIKIFIINSIYKYCIWTYRISFLKINLWLLCYNWWSSRIRIRFVGWFRIISALILNRVANPNNDLATLMLVTDVGDEMFEMLVAIVAVCVTNIHYILTLTSGIKIQKMSPISKFFHQHQKIRNIDPEQSLVRYQQRPLQIELLRQQSVEQYNNTNSKLSTFPICAINQDSYVFKKFRDSENSWQKYGRVCHQSIKLCDITYVFLAESDIFLK